jgi:hypothetical protein
MSMLRLLGIRRVGKVKEFGAFVEYRILIMIYLNFDD